MSPNLLCVHAMMEKGKFSCPMPVSLRAVMGKQRAKFLESVENVYKCKLHDYLGFSMGKFIMLFTPR